MRLSLWVARLLGETNHLARSCQHLSMVGGVKGTWAAGAPGNMDQTRGLMRQHGVSHAIPGKCGRLMAPAAPEGPKGGHLEPRESLVYARPVAGHRHELANMFDRFPFARKHRSRTLTPLDVLSAHYELLKGKSSGNGRLCAIVAGRLRFFELFFSADETSSGIASRVSSFLSLLGRFGSLRFASDAFFMKMIPDVCFSNYLYYVLPTSGSKTSNVPLLCEALLL